MRTETREARYRAAGWPGAAGDAPLARTDAERPGLARRIGAGIVSWFKTAALTLGVAYVLGWVVLTAGTVVAVRARMAPFRHAGTVERIQRVAPLRAYVLAADPGISADAAGVAMEALATPSVPPAGFTPRAIGQRAAAPWRGRELAPGLFPNARGGMLPGVPNSAKVLTAVSNGLSRGEMAVLRAIATSPGWRTLDLVARAPRVDIVGCRIVLPLSGDATWYAMPLPKFAATREWAHAAVSRAAWHLAEGRRDSAEFVLRAIVSFGFALQDNATTIIEELVGAVIAGTGRQALEQFFVITHDARGPALAAALNRAENPPFPSALSELLVRDRGRQRAALLRVWNDPTVPRGIRFESLLRLNLTSCGDGRELVFGPRREVRDAFARARADLARYPSERAVIDLIQGAIETPLTAPGLSPRNDDAAKALTFLGRIYFNPRLPVCVVTALGGF